jgi:hypothetical protein
VASLPSAIQIFDALQENAFRSTRKTIPRRWCSFIHDSIVSLRISLIIVIGFHSIIQVAFVHHRRAQKAEKREEKSPI